MIGKITKGISFRGVLDYLETKVSEGQGERIGCNMYGENARQLSTEFGMSRFLRPNLSKAVFHASLNLAPGETATNEEFLKMADIYLEEMGFNDCQYLAYRHFDREHHHIHLVVSRISLEGNVVSDKADFARSERIMRKLEKEFGLSQVIDSREAKNKQLSKGQIEKFRRTGEVPIIVQLQQILTLAISNKPLLSEFIKELSSYGVNVNIHHNSNKVFGISYELDGVAFKGSSLGKRYTWNNIKKQINYEHERDFESIRAAGTGRASENARGAGREASTNERNKRQRTQGSNISYNRIDKETYNKSEGGRFKPEEFDTEMARDAQEGKRNPNYPETPARSNDKGTEADNMESASGWILSVANSKYANGSRCDDDELALRKRRKRKRKLGPSQDFGL